MATIEAGRSRIVGLAVALFAVWISASACTKKEQAPGDDASRSALAEVANTPTTASLSVAPPDPSACFHYDGSEYVCPADGAEVAASGGALLASGTEILEGSISIRTASGVKTINLPTGRNKKLDAIFLTPKGLKLLEDHYRYDRPNRPEHRQRADSIRRYIASFNEP